MTGAARGSTGTEELTGTEDTASSAPTYGSREAVAGLALKVADNVMGEP